MDLLNIGKGSTAGHAVLRGSAASQRPGRAGPPAQQAAPVQERASQSMLCGTSAPDKWDNSGG